LNAYFRHDNPIKAEAELGLHDDPRSVAVRLISDDRRRSYEGSGYHPNVCVPGHRIRYIWGMAAHREKIDRKLGMGKVQPDFT
jgi:hypothetical protein